MIIIADYGMGNLRSVQKAFEKVGYQAKVRAEPEAVRQARGLVLPGVGAFGNCMENLKATGLVEPIVAHIASGKPFLGICLGLQLLFSRSQESPLIKGLGLLEGDVVRFKPGLKVPHMGWNCVNYAKRTPIMADVPDGSYFYFVHSYYASPKDASVVAARTDYGANFASVIWRDNLYALQFHPEKSQGLGLKVLARFGEICARGW